MTQFLLRMALKGRDPGEAANRILCGNLASLVGIVCNVLLFAGKFLAGTWFGSIAITADAINNLSDASGNIISLVGFKLASRPADPEHPYGHARFEYLAGLAVSVMILVIGVELGKESLVKIFQPQPVRFSALSLTILAVSIAVKLWMASFNRTVGKLIHSETLLATAADSRNDVISTSAVLLSTVVTRLSGLSRLDGIVGLAVALFILHSGAGLVKDTVDPLLGHTPDPEMVHAICQKVLSYPGVLGMHDLMVHDYGPGNRFASLHVEMAAESDVLESHDLIDRIEQDFLENDHLQMTIHYDPIVTKDPHVEELRDFLSRTAKQIDPSLAVHDVRIVTGPTHTNVVFDCVTPAGFARPEKELKEIFGQKLGQQWPDHRCVMKVEPAYAGIQPENHL